VHPSVDFKHCPVSSTAEQHEPLVIAKRELLLLPRNNETTFDVVVQYL